MSGSYRPPYRVTGLDEFGLPAEPPPLPPAPPPGAARMSRRGLITFAGGIALAGVTLLPGLRADDPMRELAEQQVTGEPPIYDCTAWGARQPSSPLTELDYRPSKIIVHHTATANQDDTSAAALGVLARAIQKDHMDNRDWPDSGQNFLISRGGYIAEGCHGSLRTLLGGTSFIEGAHCVDQNDSSIGIEDQGTYTDVTPPAALWNSLAVMCAFVCHQYAIPAIQIYGHRDFNDTACPGDELYALLPTLRMQVARALVGARPAQPTQPAQPNQPTQPNPNAPNAATPDQRVFASARTLTVPHWPLLRIADQGPAVLAAQYLLRGAGIPAVALDGQFGRGMADAVYAFQRKHRLPPTGMIGGGSWPLLAVPVRPGSGGYAEQAVQVLLRATPTPPNPRPAYPTTTVGPTTWQRLLASHAPTT
ncbi:MAG TPA: N-acetylmuramoyl-L-alanine amidase [Pseudonocardia sp.]|jgi:hypothetical protein|uniref:peptidoglycan recognition protein family protein n=1 Tax=Pseudonocardia sp. Cha107L01 TaxID=3457576 RepID=UPI002F54CEE7